MNSSFMKWGNKSPEESVVNMKANTIKITFIQVLVWEKNQIAMPQIDMIYVEDSAL